MRLIDDKGESLFDIQSDAGDLSVNDYTAYSRRQLFANAAIAASCVQRARYAAGGGGGGFGGLGGGGFGGLGGNIGLPVFGFGRSGGGLRRDHPTPAPCRPVWTRSQ